MEPLQKQLDKAEHAMEKAYTHIQITLAKINAGRAIPSMLDGIMVTYYGNATPINQVATVSTPDARTLVIKPWEKRCIPEIEKAILESRLALTPQNDGEIIRLNIPPLTEERRKSLVKQAKSEAEQGRVSTRNVRKETKETLKKLQKEGVSADETKRAEEKVQTLTNTYINKIDQLFACKEAELMEV